MLQRLESPDDVIAIRLSGKIAECDRDAVVDRVDDQMSKPGRAAVVANQECGTGLGHGVVK